MSSSPNFYTVLEIAQAAPAAEVKRAYRRLVRIFHPDANPSPEAAHRFREIQLAYETLSDPVKRSAYDRILLQSAGYISTGRESAFTADQIMRQAEDLMAYLNRTSQGGINYDALADFVMGILANDSILVLIRRNDRELNSRLINMLLDASERILAVRAFSEIAARMRQLQPHLNEEVVQRIERELQFRVKREKQHRLVPVAALIMITLFILVMLLVVNH